MPEDMEIWFMGEQLVHETTMFLISEAWGQISQFHEMPILFLELKFR